MGDKDGVTAVMLATGEAAAAVVAGDQATLAIAGSRVRRGCQVFRGSPERQALRASAARMASAWPTRAWMALIWWSC
jgi:putative Ca2+/H+ antiporter (TMEM165/GDT1 family)